MLLIKSEWEALKFEEAFGFRSISCIPSLVSVSAPKKFEAAD